MKLGEEVQINDNVHIAAGQLVEIGNHVLIASRVFISDINHGNFREGEMFDLSVSPEKQTLFFDPVRIEDNVWIGESVCILPGVTIGKHSVVGALSCVTKSIPPYSIAVGNPARVVKQYNFQTCSWERV
ncbi:DapH/DapD/GlmU-related protein [Bacteroides thetaiotaomicron]|uniref:DapH/DapD/GlmU-related protein n=1 Tax=Bacteroides thetaiotaomicron TaxID=818 RepID=UPI003566C1B9